MKLIYERRHGVAGSKLRTRLVAAFVGLSLIPTVLLFLVSINFLSYSIDNWFSIRIGDALNRTLEVAQLYYQQSADQAKYYARQLSADISKNSLYEGEKFLYLKALVERRHKTYKLNVLEVHIENQKENVVVRDQEHPQMVPKPLSPKCAGGSVCRQGGDHDRTGGERRSDPGGGPHLFPCEPEGWSSDSSWPATTFRSAWSTRST